jgi:hypothetical protein
MGSQNDIIGKMEVDNNELYELNAEVLLSAKGDR